MVGHTVLVKGAGRVVGDISQGGDLRVPGGGQGGQRGLGEGGGEGEQRAEQSHQGYKPT